MPTVDTLAPQLNIVSPTVASTYSTNTATNIVATANDFGTGVTNMTISIINPLNPGISSQIASQNFPASPGTLRTISVSYTFDTPGVYYITARAVDKSRNAGAIMWTVTRSNSSTSTTTSSSTTLSPCSSLPPTWILNAPPAFAQGGEGSCGGHCAALTFSIDYYYYTNATSYSQSTNIFSPEYLICKDRELQLSQNGCILSPGVGSAVGRHYDNCMTYGCCRWSILPYSQNAYGCQTDPSTCADVCVCNTCPPWGSWDPICQGVACHPCLLTSVPAANTDAANFKITWYGRVAGGFADICTLKRLIRNGHALYFQLTMDSNITYAPSDPNYVWRVRANDSVGGPHCMVLIGYDDTKQAWLAQNSWGPNWANNGRIWLDYTLSAQTLSAPYWVTYRPDKNPFPII